MPLCQRGALIGALCISSATLTSPASAYDASMSMGRYSPVTTLVELAFGHSSTKWRYDDETGTTETDELTLTLAEPLAEHTLGALDLGLAGSYQNRRSLTDNLTFSGSSAGVSLHHTVPLAVKPLVVNWHGTLDLAYRYYALSDYTTTTTARWKWHDFQISPGVSLLFASRMELNIAALYHVVRGHEDINTENSVSRTGDFDNDDRLLSATTLTWHVDASGAIGAKVTGGSGDDTSWLLFFNRGY